MTEKTAFDESRCRGMRFAELAGFIEDSLARLFEPGPAEDGRPRSEEEFRKAWGVLREKFEGLPDEPPPTPPPPRDALEAVRQKRERTEARLRSAPRDPSIKKRDVRQMERSRERLDRQIREMEESGEYPRRPTAGAPAPKLPEGSAERTLYEILGKIERTFRPDSKVPTSLSPWRLVPPSEMNPTGLRRHYDELQRRNPGVRFDPDRLDKALSLKPDHGLRNWEGFDGYVLYTFPSTGSALLECALVGNAIYVIHSDWERWSGQTKGELKAEADRGGEVVRIEHRGDDWFGRVRRELGVR